MVALVETVLLLGHLVSAAGSLESDVFSEFTIIVDCSALLTSSSVSLAVVNLF